MLVSPLLSASHVESIHELFERQQPEDEILGALKDFSVEEKLHLLRFLYHKPDISRSYEPSLLRIWFSLVPQHDEEALRYWFMIGANSHGHRGMLIIPRVALSKH